LIAAEGRGDARPRRCGFPAGDPGTRFARKGFPMYTRATPPRVAALFALLSLVVLGSTLIAALRASHPAASRGPVGPTGLSGRFAPQPGAEPREDLSSQEEWETFWTQRLTYPTGRFDPAWISNAVAEDRRVPRAVPGGQVIYDRERSRSPLELDPNRFTSLGPQSVNAFGRNWSGRINSIAFDPVSTNVAYLAVNGGGIWKTTNCCSETTTFAPVTDLPDIPIIAVDDVTV